ncbi:hypothetical protein ACFWSF_39205 [Streptomyces sp. NPDC058611]|uniref:hypothetical protein n=1 Tax=unclassified Streptomyces TaxID=2593676 RepID=UPI003657DBBC
MFEQLTMDVLSPGRSFTAPGVRLRRSASGEDVVRAAASRAGAGRARVRGG